ncbi:hypothetical protein ACFPRL_04670 [Pseudoclavibacter helvolus]
MRLQLQRSTGREHRRSRLLQRKNLRPPRRDRRRIRRIKPRVREVGATVLLHAPEFTGPVRHLGGSWITFQPENPCPQGPPGLIPRFDGN